MELYLSHLAESVVYLAMSWERRAVMHLAVRHGSSVHCPLLFPDPVHPSQGVFPLPLPPCVMAIPAEEEQAGKAPTMVSRLSVGRSSRRDQMEFRGQNESPLVVYRRHDHLIQRNCDRTHSRCCNSVRHRPTPAVSWNNF